MNRKTPIYYTKLFWELTHSSLSGNLSGLLLFPFVLHRFAVFAKIKISSLKKIIGTVQKINFSIAVNSVYQKSDGFFRCWFNQVDSCCVSELVNEYSVLKKRWFKTTTPEDVQSLFILSFINVKAADLKLNLLLFT